MREALALQRFYELDARGGTRYTEMLTAHFGVRAPDARLQRPEYIGGKRIPINIQQVLQTSSTDDVTPLGTTGAFSLTSDSSDSFTYSAVEHGLIIGCACIRTQQSYQYGISREWTRKDRTDYYFPSFAHIGEQGVLNQELYAQRIDDEECARENEEVFGYQEAWAEYRQKLDIITGEMRSQYPQSLDFMHYAEKLDSLPVLGSNWIRQSQNVVDRTLAVPSSLSDQFHADFFFNYTSVRPIPLYSIPSLNPHF